MNSSPNSGPLNRARQSSRHVEIKLQVGAELARRGFEVMYEFRLADVVGFHLDTGQILAVEVELSPKNVAANLRRNLRHGFRTILIVVPGNKIDRTKKLVHAILPPAEPPAVAHVTSTDDLTNGLTKIIGKKI